MEQAQYLAHHGIKGQKWGVRRWQNPDGTLTEEGKKHYHDQIDYEYKWSRASLGVAGGIYGLTAGMMAAPFATVAAGPAAGAAIAAGATFLGSAAMLKITKRTAQFDRDEKHMYVESGKYFMQETLNANVRR